MNSVELLYVGCYTNFYRSYEVFEDVTNGVINVFFKSKNDVECYQISKEAVEKETSDNLLENTRLWWVEFLKTKSKKIEPFLQVFPLEFWNDFVIAKKNGSYGMSVEFVKVTE